MLVRRVEVSFLVSIQRDSRVTGAKAMSSSLDGSGAESAALRTNRSREGPIFSFGSAGFHLVPGATLASIGTLRGPARRSSRNAIDVRQLDAAIARCASVSVTWASFSASANVPADTAGPTAGAVPKVGGAPGVLGTPDEPDGVWDVSPPLHAAAAPINPSGAWTMKSRRELTGPRGRKSIEVERRW